jgi:hypothetical protein
MQPGGGPTGSAHGEPHGSVRLQGEMCDIAYLNVKVAL